MAIQPIVGSNPRRNNGGLIVYGGNVPTNSAITANPGKTLVGKPSVDPEHLPKGIADETSEPVLAIYSDGTKVLRQNQVISYPITSGLANNGVSLPNIRTIFYRGVVEPYTPYQTQSSPKVSTAMRNNGWHEISGKFVASSLSATSTDMGNDRPTLAIPGEFVFSIGKRVPTQADYSRKTN